MNTSIVKKILYVAIPLAALAIVVIKIKGNKQKAEQAVHRYDETAPVIVELETVSYSKLKAGRSYLGNFAPLREAKIGAELQGKIRSVSVNEGDHVTEGQELIRLDDALLRHQLSGIEVKIEGLEADVKRYGVLVEADAIKGVQLEKAQLGLKAALTEKETLLETLKKSVVRAPFNGVVTAKLTEVGAFAVPAMPLLQITDLASLDLTIQVSEAELSQFKTGQRYPVRVRSLPDRTFTGTVAMIGSKADMSNNFPVKFRVDNTDDKQIKAGMFGEVQLTDATATSALTVPSSSILLSEGKNSVYVVQDGKANLRTITVGEKFDNLVVVLQGLDSGNVVVVQGMVNLFDGANVNTK